MFMISSGQIWQVMVDETNPIDWRLSMLTKRYLASVKNLPEIFAQIVKGTAPSTFNIEHLKGIGFTSSNDRAIIPLLKDLGFLNESGSPTERYHAYRAGGQQGRAVLGQALLEAYQDLFHVNANPTDADRDAIRGKFKTAHNATDRVAEQQAATFYALLKLADVSAAREGRGESSPLKRKIEEEKAGEEAEDARREGGKANREGVSLSLGYKIEVHLPATKDIEVYNAIFRSLKENILA
jgi:hypothetical protein